MQPPGTGSLEGVGTPVAQPRGTESGAPARPTVALRLFASARQAAGTGRADIDAATVGEVLREAESRYGEDFAAVLAISRVWVNGAPADDATALAAGDEVAILPPVSGGAAGPATEPAR